MITSAPVISWKEWEETYKPTTDTMFDFYDDIRDSIESGYHLWTVVDNNPNSVYLDVIPGHRIFNRLGFYVTEIPWEDENITVSNDPSYRE
jgi:hypothetical protein